MLDSIKGILSERPFSSISTSLGGYFLSLVEYLSPVLRFSILVFSTVTAISVAYVQYNKARRVWNAKEENPNKKGSRNS